MSKIIFIHLNFGLGFSVHIFCEYKCFMNEVLKLLPGLNMFNVMILPAGVKGFLEISFLVFMTVTGLLFVIHSNSIGSLSDLP